jgi:hypothetical protein
LGTDANDPVRVTAPEYRSTKNPIQGDMKKEVEVMRPIGADVEQLYRTNYESLRDLALSSGRLLAPDADNLVAAIASRLSEYDGPTDQEHFAAWASEIVIAAAAKMESFYDLYKQYRKSVLAGVWYILNKNRDLAEHDNPGRTARYIAADVWLWVFAHLDDLAIPGTAKLSVRLQAQAKYHALTWRKTRLRQRAKEADIDVSLLGKCDYEHDDEIRLWLEPDYEGGEEERPSGLVVRRSIPFSGEDSEKSGMPKLLCPQGCGLQATILTSGTDGIVLVCGHSRPSFLPARMP